MTGTSVLASTEPLASPAKESSSPDLEASHLQRKLSSRHLQFVAIGGCVGVGLFLASGSALAKAGPAGALFAFVFLGTILYSVMASLSEMATFIPIPAGYPGFAARFVHPSLGFSVGCMFWFSWVVTFALELVASGLIIQYWARNISIGVWIAVFWVILTASNFLPIKWYAKTELAFTSLKVITIVGFVIFAMCVAAGASPSRQGVLGFRYWRDPGAFSQYLVDGPAGAIVGICAVLVQAAFSYQGAELVAVPAGEAANPRKTVPRAVRNTFWGIFAMFVSVIFAIGLTVPSDHPDLLGNKDKTDATASPLVIAANLAGVPVLSHVINAVLLTAVLTAGNCNVYCGSRILVNLADEALAPAAFARTNGWGTPYWAVLATAAPGSLAFLKLFPKAADVFEWLLNVVGVAGLLCWLCLNLSHLRFMSALKAQGLSRKKEETPLAYVAPAQPWLAWYGLVLNGLLVLGQGFTAFVPWSVSEFFAAYISVFLFFGVFAAHWAIKRGKFVKTLEMDLVTGRVEA